MTECERLLEELKSKAVEVVSAEEAARRPGASEKDISDARMLREAFIGLRQLAADQVAREGTSRDAQSLAQVMAQLS
ncbi:MAG: hypothetical protein AB7F22_15320 [Reyranella sp.]|uniref:hypothetical protein n=1 Tax=Reyranella sp. TaxID=1929291 RepID=UPI003D10762D